MNYVKIYFKAMCLQLCLLVSSTSIVYGAAYDESLNLNWGVSERQGYRGTMEDAYAAQVRFNNRSNEAYFGIFDGHTGDSAAKATAEGLDTPKGRIQPLSELIAQSRESGNNRYIKAFELMDKNFLEMSEGEPYKDAGTTAVTAHIIKQGSQFVANIAWTGDARAILVDRKGNVIQATTDHKPDSAKERERITAAGGTIKEASGNGPARILGISTSRAIGDRIPKELAEERSLPRLIIPTPDVETWDLSQAHFLVLACDGVWDKHTNEQAAKVVFDALKDKKQQTPERARITENPFHPGLQEPNFVDVGNNNQARYAARVLRDASLYSRDNISALVIEFPFAETQDTLSSAKPAEAFKPRFTPEEIAQRKAEQAQRIRNLMQAKEAPRQEQERLAAEKEARHKKSEDEVKRLQQEEERRIQQERDDEALARQLAEQWALEQ